MLLKLFGLSKLTFTSNGSRNSWRYFNLFCFQNKLKRLSLKKRCIAGRARSGRLVIWTKGSFLHRQRSWKLNYRYFYNRLGLVATFQLVPFRNKLISLIVFASGASTYFISTTTNVLFGYFFQNRFRSLRRLIKYEIVSPLFKIKKLSFVCLLSLSPNKVAQYGRSSGVKCKLLKLDAEKQLGLVQLPSMARKFFSYFSQTFLGEVSCKNKRYFKNTRSGYWRAFGLKPIVRGVAMNPVDHPHGGRTKTVKSPKTPWGKVTKLK